MTTRILDHLVYTVPNLEAAMDDLEARLGVRPAFGGYHATRGTKNALVNLDNGAYLEILAADDENTATPPPRWMGVDLLTGPKLTRWAVKSDDLPADQAILRAYDAALGEISAGSRQTAGGGWLRWEMILPLPAPEVDIIPFMVDWRQSEIHPHDNLPDMGCSVVEMSATHPEPEKINAVLQQLGVKLTVKAGAVAGLRAVIRCPKGEVVL